MQRENNYSINPESLSFLVCHLMNNFNSHNIYVHKQNFIPGFEQLVIIRKDPVFSCTENMWSECIMRMSCPFMFFRNTEQNLVFSVDTKLEECND
jgi:hypothetical protein